MKSHGCQFCDDGDRRPASRIWPRSSAGIGGSANDLTLRREVIASQVCMMIPTPATPCSFSTARSVQAEVGEIEARRHNAADQHRRLASRRSALPYAAGNDGLRPLARVEIAAEHEGNPGGRLVTGAARAQVQRAATVPEPQLVGAHYMPA